MAPRQLSEDNLHDINTLFTRGDWRSLLENHGEGGDAERSLLWPKPEEQDLNFIVDSVKLLGKDSIVSIGCGTGLLEWFLRQATGFPVYGVEVDKKYWSVARCNKKVFIDAVYPEDEHFSELTTSDKNALLFCYFNNGTAFKTYLDKYKGNCLIILGPHEAGRHTDPSPFDPFFETSGWNLIKNKEIRETKDFIAIYQK